VKPSTDCRDARDVRKGCLFIGRCNDVRRTTAVKLRAFGENCIVYRGHMNDLADEDERAGMENDAA
jgi:hypothetical protein